MQRLGWRTRAGIVLSVVWLVAIYAITGGESHWAGFFALIGIGPLAIIWGTAWIIGGYRAERSKSSDGQIVDPHRKAVQTRRVVGLALLIASGVSVDYFATKAGYDGPAKLGYFFGFYIWGLLLAWVVWTTGFKRLPGGLLLLTGIVFASAASWESFKMEKEFTDANNYAKYGSVLIARAYSGQNISAQDIANAHTGRLEPFLSAQVRYLNSENEIKHQFSATVKRVHFYDIFTPDTFASAAGLHNSENSLAAVKLAWAQVKAARKLDRQKFAVEVNALALRESVKERIIAQFLKSPGGSEATSAEYYKIEDAFLTNTSEMIDFLKSRQGTYKVRNHKFFFRTGNDAKTYNNLLSARIALVEREARWQRQMKERGMRGVERLSSMAK